jgi:hypothetical protein
MLKYVLIYNEETGLWDGEFINNDDVIFSASDKNTDDVINKINWQAFHVSMNKQFNQNSNSIMIERRYYV